MHIHVILALENIDIVDEISCADAFLVDSSRFVGYLGGLEALKILLANSVRAFWR